MGRILACMIALLGLALPAAALADPADIDAAARGVVRVIIIEQDGDTLVPISHGTGFAVTGDTIVTNAHVVRDALRDDALRIGIVPSGGGEAVYGRILASSAKSDLALVRVTGPLRLAPLALAGGPPPDSGEVTSAGYPMNVDRAQGLEIGDIFRSQPPVKSRGFVSGTRPSRQFDSILHTAPIARGNSGGPLLDNCGRVLGVNSFGADSDQGDAEFFFAVSNRELVPFLKANGITARVNDMPCRSIADLDAQERARLEQQQSAARQDLAQRAEVTREQRERAQLEAEQSVLTDREDRVVLAFVLLLVAFGLGQWALALWNAQPREMKRMRLVGAGAAVAGLVALAAYLTRPGLDEIDRRVAAAMAPGPGASRGAEARPSDLRLTCRIVPERSRVTSSETAELDFDWTASGCVNARTQYGFRGGDWSRVFVPDSEDSVSVSRFDPASRTYRIDRYLLSRPAMDAAREARARYDPPQCGAEGAAARLGDLQSEILGQLPPQPNERLVYECGARP